MSDDPFEEGSTALASRDPVIARLLQETGPVTRPHREGTNFEALVRSITYQQLASAAANAIYGRLAQLLGEVEPDRLVSVGETALRAAGLSRAKVASVLDLASKVQDGSVVLDDAVIQRMSDDEIVASLVRVRGIGEWTAKVFSMVHLGRPDILPSGDLGIRQGYGLGWGVPIPTEKELAVIGEAYRPYRSVFAWYCWRAAETLGHSTAGAVAE